MAPLICPICRRTYDDSFTWYVCDHCGNRCCPYCMNTGKQTGPYGVGHKCGQCFQGWMKERRFR